MSGSELAVIATPANGHGKTLHALAVDLPEYKETWCGRNATEWKITRGEMTEGAFIINAHACLRCVRIMLK